MDVCTLGEQSKTPLADVLHIPADEVPKDGPLFVLTKDGFLGHTTLRTLKAEGWQELYNITGGYSAARWSGGWNFAA